MSLYNAYRQPLGPCLVNHPALLTHPSGEQFNHTP
jgi:hypothetical protein